MWAMISLLLGIMVYVALPALAPSLSLPAQLKIGRSHYSLAMRCYGQAAIVWRTLGGPKLKPVSIDDEQSLGQVTLSSGTLSDDQELPFKDPDSRLYRLHKKPLAVVPELMPAAVDAELAEVGHWARQHDLERGIISDGVVDPYVRVSNSLRAINPLDALHVAGKHVEPEFIESAKQLTEARYHKYKGGIGAVETAATLAAFATGAGGVVGIVYVKRQIMEDGGSSATSSVSLPPGSIVPPDLLHITPDLFVGLTSVIPL